MAMTYEKALVVLKNAVKTVRECGQDGKWEEAVSLENAVGRVAASNCHSPVSTPEFDTSAMDGYAVSSDATRRASPESPVIFQIRGTVAAGDDPSLPLPTCTYNCDDGVEPCVKIMTGARFPTSATGNMLDACVKIEDTIPMPPRDTHFETIYISKPVLRNANRRFAGEDIQKTDMIVQRGQIIQASHLMPLASVGIDAINVRCKPRICIWSTGNELTSKTSRIPDVNGVYLTAAGRELGAEAKFMGTLEDNIPMMARDIQQTLETSPVDILITSGGVSVGQFDCVRQALELLDATIVFHGLAIRPGHPVLFALLPSPLGKVAFFGLPGNPGAAAACFRFLTTPYLRHLLGQDGEEPIYARPRKNEMEHNGLAGCRHSLRKGQLDIFRPGLLQVSSRGENVVSEVATQLGPSKLSPFIRANCWIHLTGSHQTDEAGGVVPCYPSALLT